MSVTREDLHVELDQFEVRLDLDRFATKLDLERFATKDFLRSELEPFATKADLNALRDEMAQGFADLRRCMEILIEDVRSTNRLIVETLSARIDASDTRTTTGLAGHERRIGGLETRVTGLEHPRKRR
jgi:hypothetical protein